MAYAAAMTEQNVQIRLASRPVGRPTAENFTIAHAPVKSPGEGEVLIRTQYLSLDPYMRGRMSDAPSYAAPVKVGGLMVGATVGEVVSSNEPGFKPGDIVLAYTGWQQYGVQTAPWLRKLDPGQAPVTTALGVLGMPGFTAYAGLTQIGQPKPGETVVVAAAILRKSLTVRGFIQNEFADSLMSEFLARATGWVQDGSLKYCEDIVDGLENAPEAFIGMLEGKNFGKLIVRVS
jgi:NADPH-dependent curcumin reductase CurA